MEKTVKFTASQVQPRLRQRPPAGMCHWPGKNRTSLKKQKPCTVKNGKICPKAKCFTNLKPETFLQNPEMHIKVLQRQEGREE